MSNADLIIKLVQAGSAGVAVICMLMSFWLLVGINKQPQTDAALPVLREKNRAACMFMGFSVLCLVLALGGAYLERPPAPSPSRIQVMWSPSEKPKWLNNDDIVPRVFVFVGGKKRPLAKDERIDYPENGLIVLDYQSIADYLYALPRIQAAAMLSADAGMGQ